MYSFKNKFVCAFKNLFFWKFIIWSAIVWPFLVQAQINVPQGFPNQAWTAQDVVDLISQFKDFLMFIGIILIIVMLVISGLTLLLAGGNPNKIAQGKKMLLWSILGAVIVLASIGILNTIIQILQTKTI